jgi:catechol 2,3-dioxygenase-like lactoylglutathione lyase family enzyme
MIKALDHSALISADLERTRWFYCTVLGLEEIPRPESFRFGGCWFRGPGFELHMILEQDTTARAGFGDAGPGARIGLAHHLGFEVEDLAALTDRLRAHAVPIFAGPMQRGDGVVQLYVNDPDGNFLEFFTHTPDSALPVIERAAVSERRPA